MLANTAWLRHKKNYSDRLKKTLKYCE